MERKIREKLKNELGYSDFSAARTAEDLVHIEDNDIKTALNNWLSGEGESCVSEGTYTTEILVKKHNMKYPAALIFIDWLREAPRQAMASLQIRM